MSALSDYLTPVDTDALARATGKSGVAVRAWKRGSALPRPAALPAIAKAARVPLRDIKRAYTEAVAERNEAAATSP